MKSKLDQIEARLQALIESSAAFFTQGDTQQHLAHQLVRAVQENLEDRPDGKSIAPEVFTITLNPDSLNFWQEHGSLLNTIGASLQQAARENGIYFSSRPTIRLVPDPDLPANGIKVQAGDLQEKSGQTSAFTPVPTVPQPAAVPLNAFLIVEGSRIFPLNRAVINIGRRPDNHLVLQDPRVSRAHAQIRAIRGQYIVFDLNSTGGTLVNGRRVHQSALKPGDGISLSGVPLIYGEDPLPGDDSQEDGFTKSINTSPSGDPPEIIQ